MQKTWGKMFVLPLSKIFPIIFRIPQEVLLPPSIHLSDTFLIQQKELSVYEENKANSDDQSWFIVSKIKKIYASWGYIFKD